MRESVEFRIPEEDASRFLAADAGRVLGETVRALEVAVDDPLYLWVGELDRRLQEEGTRFFYGWEVKRRYTHKELEAAELFGLEITAVFEPTGEECGTIYDETTACPACGAGRTQLSELILDLRRAPKSKHIARTIADEWIVSQRLAELLVDARMTGFELRRVRHKARYQDDPVDLSKTPSGRQILRLAAETGVPHPTWDFWVWLNRPEQRELADRADLEHAERLEQRDRRRPRPIPAWYQLVVASPAVPTVAPTRFGIDPFDEDVDGHHRCPFGHVSGLNQLSELWVSRGAWDGSDVVMTKDMVGTRRGLLVPTPMLLISPRLRQLLRAEGIKGYKLDVAHLA